MLSVTVLKPIWLLTSVFFFDIISLGIEYGKKARIRFRKSSEVMVTKGTSVYASSRCTNDICLDVLPIILPDHGKKAPYIVDHSANCRATALIVDPYVSNMVDFICPEKDALRNHDRRQSTYLQLTASFCKKSCSPQRRP